MEIGEEKEFYYMNSLVYILDVLRGGSRFVFGGSDCLVNVWDSRESASVKACLKFKFYEVSLLLCVFLFVFVFVCKVSDEYIFDF